MAEKKNKKKGNELDELSLDELIERCKQIKELLASLENQYRAAEITEQSYKQTKEANRKKLAEVRTRLEEWGVKDDDAPAPSPAATQNPAASNSAAPAPAIASAPVTAKTASSPPLSQKTAPVPPPVHAPIVMPPSDAPEPSEPIMETPATEVPPSPPASFAQKLKQQFTHAPSRQSDDPAYVSQTVQLELQKFQEKFNVELERIKASMDAMKETRASTDERIHMLTEGIAELRSNVFQREAGIKEQEMKLTKLKEMVDEIEPQKISKDFSKRDKTANDMELRIEKLEVKTGDLSKTINEINALLKSIGGLENAADINHEAAKKLEKIEEINKSAERLSLKIEKIYLDMNKRLERFNIYEARQDNISEIVNDMIRNFDALSLKFESYAEKKEMTTLKEDIADVLKKMDELKKTLKKAVPFAEAQVPEELSALETEKEDIESLLSSIEYGHERKQIKDDEYASMKEKNEARLKEIKQKIADIMKKLASAPEEKENAGAANAKNQGPSLVNAMVDDMNAIKTAAKKNAEDAKKKEEAAKKEMENAPETESEEDTEETGDEENEEAEGEEESETENEENKGEEKHKSENGEETEEGAEKDMAEKQEDSEAEEIKKIAKTASTPAAINQNDAAEEKEAAPKETEPLAVEVKTQGNKQKKKAIQNKANENKKHAVKHAKSGSDDKAKQHPTIDSERATRLFLRANEIEKPAKKIRPKRAAKNGKKKAVKHQKAAAKTSAKITHAQKNIAGTEGTNRKAADFKSYESKTPASNKIAEEKIRANASIANASSTEAVKKPRKSLRASHDLFVPAKNIKNIASIVSNEQNKAQQPEKPAADLQKEGAEPSKQNNVQGKENAAQKASAPAKKSEEKKEDNPLLLELDDSLKQGLISKETYENTKKLLMMG